MHNTRGLKISRFHQLASTLGPFALHITAVTSKNPAATTTGTKTKRHIHFPPSIVEHDVSGRGIIVLARATGNCDRRSDDEVESLSGLIRRLLIADRGDGARRRLRFDGLAFAPARCGRK
jgi:hypothetical protein